MATVNPMLAPTNGLLDDPKKQVIPQLAGQAQGNQQPAPVAPQRQTTGHRQQHAIANPAPQIQQPARTPQEPVRVSDEEKSTATYKANTRTVDPSKETVAGQLRGLLEDPDSNYMQRARTSAWQYANSRGLLNSSIAATAGEAAAIDAALPIAQQDAGIYFQQGLENQAAINTAHSTNAQTLHNILIKKLGEAGLDNRQEIVTNFNRYKTDADNAVEVAIQNSRIALSDRELFMNTYDTLNRAMTAEMLEIYTHADYSPQEKKQLLAELSGKFNKDVRLSADLLDVPLKEDDWSLGLSREEQVTRAAGKIQKALQSLTPEQTTQLGATVRQAIANGDAELRDDLLNKDVDVAKLSDFQVGTYIQENKKELIGAAAVGAVTGGPAGAILGVLGVFFKDVIGWAWDNTVGRLFGDKDDDVVEREGWGPHIRAAEDARASRHRAAVVEREGWGAYVGSGNGGSDNGGSDNAGSATGYGGYGGLGIGNPGSYS